MLDKTQLKQLIQVYPDFPKPGSNTRDLSQLLSTPGALHLITSDFAQRFLDAELDLLVALQGRGALFAAALAYRLNLPLALIHEQGAEPGAVITEEAVSSQDAKTLQGTKVLEMRQGQVQAGARVLLFDDVIASGSSLLAAITLIRRQQGEVVGVATLIDLPDKGGSERLLELRIPAYSIMAFAGT